MAELRELRAEDAEAVATLVRDAAGGERSIDAEEVLSWLHGSATGSDDRRVLVAHGEDVAYLDVSGPGREDALFDWAEARAAERDAQRARVPIPERQTALAGYLAARGYTRERSSFEMLIELEDEAPAEPAWPAGIEVSTYRDEDEQAVYETDHEAFRDDWFHRREPPEVWRDLHRRARGFDPALWFLAWDGDELAAILLAYSERMGDTGLGWIGTLGVRKQWRRRGLGEALLRHAFGALHARGLRRVGLGVDAQNPTGATRLYERVGMRVSARSETWEKEL